MKIDKIATYVMYVLMAIGAVLVIMGYVFASDNPLADGSWVDLNIIWTVILCGIAILCAIASEGFNAAQDPKQLLKAGISVVAVVAVLAIFWALGSDEPLPLVGYEGDQNQGGWLKVSDMGLFTVYLALAGAIIAVVASEIYNLFK